MSRFRRIAVGTVALAVGGFVVGALVGGISSAVYYFPRSGWGVFTHASDRFFLLRNAMIVGAITGISTPLLAWIGLRRVSIGRVVAIGALGAATGALSAALLLGPIFPTFFSGMTTPVLGAAAGSLAAAVLIRLTSRVRRPAPLDAEHLTPQAR